MDGEVEEEPVEVEEMEGMGAAGRVGGEEMEEGVEE